ncbi:MAG: hypothetical protein M1827_005753 [Pycnora praestabilis]|nr:MAG: hypothetical protein M1827_005753 [Pycnora praestabilis]
MPTYRIELASSGRSGCRNKECQDKGFKIEKGALRFGTQVEIAEHQSWHWRHWYVHTDARVPASLLGSAEAKHIAKEPLIHFRGCVTPQQLGNLQEVTNGDLDYVDGYDQVDAMMQDKIKRALEQGHVDDVEWNGDVEKNRPGQHGMRKPTPKKKKTDEGVSNRVLHDSFLPALNIKQAENGEEGDKSPSKAPQKRGRARQSAGDGEEDPVPKKAKAGARKGKKTEVVEETDLIVEEEEEEEEDLPKPKKGKARLTRTKPKLEAIEDNSEMEDAEPKGRGKANGKASASKKAATLKKRGKVVAAIPEDPAEETTEEVVEEPIKTKRGRPTKKGGEESTKENAKPIATGGIKKGKASGKTSGRASRSKAS